MKVAKIKEQKENKKEIVNEEYSLKQMLKIIVILLVIFGLFYLVTSMVVKNRKEVKQNTNNIIEIDNSKILLNNLLDGKESDYYCLALMESKYDIGGYSKIDYTSIYNNYIKSYSSKENALKFYYIDLDDALNKNYVSEEINIGEDLNNLKLNDEVLFKISNGKIVESYVGNTQILEVLSNL